MHKAETFVVLCRFKWRTFELLWCAQVDYPVGNSCLPNWNAHQLYNIDQNQWERSLRAADLGRTSGSGQLVDDDRDYIIPKLITVIRNGSRPRKAIRILLNKKTAFSFAQVLSEITEAVKLDSGAVKKIFTITGQQASWLTSYILVQANNRPITLSCGLWEGLLGNLPCLAYNKKSFCEPEGQKAILNVINGMLLSHTSSFHSALISSGVYVETVAAETFVITSLIHLLIYKALISRESLNLYLRNIFRCYLPNVLN